MSWLAYLLVGLLILLATVVLYDLWFRHPRPVYHLPPGNAGWPFIGETISFITDVSIYCWGWDACLLALQANKTI